MVSNQLNPSNEVEININPYQGLKRNIDVAPAPNFQLKSTLIPIRD